MQPGIYSSPSQLYAYIIVDRAGAAHYVPGPAGWEARTPYTGDPTAYRRLSNLEAASIARALRIPGSVWGAADNTVWTAARIATALEDKS